nr:Nad6 [Porphyridium purpureum]UBY46135.1 Nad6 [Porphyridium purpureum]
MIFLISYTLTCFCSFMVILSSQTVHSLLFLTLTFCNASCLIISTGGEFLALLLIIVYVGAIAILFLFTIMLLNIRIEFSRVSDWVSQKSSALGFCLFVTSLINYYILLEQNLLLNSKPLRLEMSIWSTHQLTNLKTIGMSLYSIYSPAFLSISLILCVAMVGAILLTLHQKSNITRKQNFSYQLLREGNQSVAFRP